MDIDVSTIRIIMFFIIFVLLFGYSLYNISANIILIDKNYDYARDKSYITETRNLLIASTAFIILTMINIIFTSYVLTNNIVLFGTFDTTFIVLILFSLISFIIIMCLIITIIWINGKDNAYKINFVNEPYIALITIIIALLLYLITVIFVKKRKEHEIEY